MSSTQKVYDMIKEKNDRVDADKHREYILNHRAPLIGIFAKSIDTAMIDVKNGARSDEFPSLTIINFIINASRESYSPLEIKEFIDEIKDDSDDDGTSIIEFGDHSASFENLDNIS